METQLYFWKPLIQRHKEELAIVGDYFNNYIEIHHVISITEIGNRPINPATDFIPLCSNCHSMVHKMKSDNTKFLRFVQGAQFSIGKRFAAVPLVLNVVP